MSTKSKIQKKIDILSHRIVFRSYSTIDDTYCQIKKYVVTKEKLKQNTNYNYSHLDNVLRLFSQLDRFEHVIKNADELLEVINMKK
jgi:hypothetical protein